jgi:pimeloyl-ACP methyl ester carboxylesterase
MKRSSSNDTVSRQNSNIITCANELRVGESAYIESNTSFLDLATHHFRIFYASHSLVAILPKPMPIIVFIHGLGGQLNQFEPLLKYFCQVADVLAIDLPGCGQSPLTDRRWDQYATEALVNLVNRVIEEKTKGRKVILVGHSLGSIIAATLALKLCETCLGLVLLCPKAEISEKERKGILLATCLPEFVFNIFRKRDRVCLPPEIYKVIVVGEYILPA